MYHRVGVYHGVGMYYEAEVGVRRRMQEDGSELQSLTKA